MSGHIRYSDEFKIDAVAQVTERGYSVKEVSECLGISTNLLQSGPVGPELVGHNPFRSTVLEHCFSYKFQGCRLVRRLCHDAFQNLALVIHGPPQIVPLAVDLREELVEVPSPFA